MRVTENFNYYYTAYVITSLLSSEGTSEDKFKCSKISIAIVYRYMQI